MEARREGRLRQDPNYKPRVEPPSGLAGGNVAKFDRIEWLAMPDIQTAVNALMTDEIQTRAVTLSTHCPLGEWYGQFAYRTGTKDWMPPMIAMLFWNAEKTR
jgi:hypothetical protein